MADKSVGNSQRGEVGSARGGAAGNPRSGAERTRRRSGRSKDVHSNVQVVADDTAAAMISAEDQTAERKRGGRRRRMAEAKQRSDDASAARMNVSGTSCGYSYADREDVLPESCASGHESGEVRGGHKRAASARRSRVNDQPQGDSLHPSVTRRGRKERLSFIPLGGLGEIGKNMYAVQYGDDILVIDSGLMFPDQELPGIDCIVPDISYLEARREHVLGIVFTHGHEDHTGGLPYVLPRLDVPLYGTRLTLGLIGNKLQEDLPSYRPKLNEVKAGDVVRIGPFSVRFIAVAHSIPDGVALSIDTPLGRIVHTGDFKLDSTPIDGRVTDCGAFAEEGDKGVLLLAADSTNAERSGFTPSERIIGGTLEQLYRAYRTRRIIISSFASNVHRVQQVVDAAARFNRKIAFLGRSMIRNVELARELGYLKLDSRMIVPVEEIDSIPDNQLVIMTTGSQGEPFSGLVMMSRGEHRSVTLGDRDAVLLLASVIPGNEKLVNNTINRLFQIGCEVVYEQNKQIHVSGHASSEELKIMLNLVRPKYFVPIHGEYRHLVRHSQLAQEVGVPARNIFLMSNGDVLTFTRGAQPRVREQVQAGAILIDGNAVGGIKSDVMRERRELAEDGVMIVSVALDRYGELLAPIAVETRGIFLDDDRRNIFAEIRTAAERAVGECSSKRRGADSDAVSRAVKMRVRDVLRRHNSSYAVVLPVISVSGADTFDDDSWLERYN